MTQQHFIQRREAFWKDFEALINGSRKELHQRAAWFPQGYRELTQDLNTARSHGFDPSLIERLNRLVLEGNQILYGQHPWSWKGAVRFICRVFPQTVRNQWRGAGANFLIFYGIALFSGILCIRFPQIIYEFIAESQIAQIEAMYDPESSHFLTPREIESDADMFGFYIYNNISIAFAVFAGGIFAGFGSIGILSMNGAFLGLIAGHIINKGYGETFFSFIIGHSSFELTALILSAQAGLVLGYRLFITSGLSRAASLRKAGKTAAPLIAGSALLLVIAAVIEAFWSSRYELPVMLRYGAGLTGWVLLLAYFLFAGRKEQV